MDKIVSNVKEYFFVKEARENVFTSLKNWQFGGRRGLFGGQIIAQTVAAAILTVPPEFSLHSLHSYFILPGKYDELIEFYVERLRDGRSFATRVVHARQGKDTIFTLTCSFQKKQPYITEHQFQMPDVYPPDHVKGSDLSNIVPEFKHYNLKVLKIYDQFNYVSKVAVPKDPKLRDSFMQVEQMYKPARSGIPSTPNIKPPYFLQWVRIDEDLSQASPQLSIIFLSLISDFYLTVTNTLPYLYGYNKKKISLPMAVSLDHSIYVHNEFRVDEWLLFVLESPKLANNRGFVSGKFYTAGGKHVVSISQENVFRTKINDDTAITKHEFFQHSPENIPASASSKL